MEEEEDLNLDPQQFREYNEGQKFYSEAERNIAESKAEVLRELRMWLTSHRVESEGIGGEQPITPLIERESPAFKKIKNKALDLIESI